MSYGFQMRNSSGSVWCSDDFTPFHVLWEGQPAWVNKSTHPDYFLFYGEYHYVLPQPITTIEEPTIYICPKQRTGSMPSIYSMIGSAGNWHTVRAYGYSEDFDQETDLINLPSNFCKIMIVGKPPTVSRSGYGVRVRNQRGEVVLDTVRGLMGFVYYQANWTVTQRLTHRSPEGTAYTDVAQVDRVIAQDEYFCTKYYHYPGQYVNHYAFRTFMKTTNAKIEMWQTSTIDYQPWYGFLQSPILIGRKLV